MQQQLTFPAQGKSEPPTKMVSDDLGTLRATIAKWGMEYTHHPCCEELGAGATSSAAKSDAHPGWAADNTSGADGPIEEGTRRFLVRLSQPTQTEPFPKHTVDMHLTVASDDITDPKRMSYTIELETMVRRVIDDVGDVNICSHQWIFDRMIRSKEAFALS